MKRASETISFRADEDLARLIDEARSLFGISRGDWVRGVVIGHLHRADATEVNDRLIELRQSLEESSAESLRNQARLRRMTFTILTLVAGIPSAEAKLVVEKVFND